MKGFDSVKAKLLWGGLLFVALALAISGPARPVYAACDVHIVLPGGGRLEIYSPAGMYQNCDHIDVTPGQTYTYRLWDAKQKYTPGWTTKAFTQDDCDHNWDLTSAY
jgi:hypothetical protein